MEFGKTKVAKQEFNAAKKPIKIWDVNVDNIVISKLLTKNNSKYLIGYLDELIRPVAFLLPKIRGYVKTFELKSGNDNKNLSIIDNKSWEKFKTIWT